MARCGCSTPPLLPTFTGRPNADPPGPYQDKMDSKTKGQLVNVLFGFVLGAIFVTMFSSKSIQVRKPGCWPR